MHRPSVLYMYICVRININLAVYIYVCVYCINEGNEAYVAALWNNEG